MDCGHPVACEGKSGTTGDQPGCGWCADISDMGMLVDHLTRTYDHFTNGRISKPNTLPEEVFVMADDLATEEADSLARENERLREALAALLHEHDDADASKYKHPCDWSECKSDVIAKARAALAREETR